MSEKKPRKKYRRINLRDQDCAIVFKNDKQITHFPKIDTEDFNEIHCILCGLHQCLQDEDFVSLIYNEYKKFMDEELSSNKMDEELLLSLSPDFEVNINCVDDFISDAFVVYQK